jgi:hypothetical protein
MMTTNNTKNTKRWHVRSKRTGKIVATAASRDSAREWKQKRDYRTKTETQIAAGGSAYYLFDSMMNRKVR